MKTYKIIDKLINNRVYEFSNESDFNEFVNTNKLKLNFYMDTESEITYIRQKV